MSLETSRSLPLNSGLPNVREAPKHIICVHIHLYRYIYTIHREREVVFFSAICSPCVHHAPPDPPYHPAAKVRSLRCLFILRPLNLRRRCPQRRHSCGATVCCQPGSPKTWRDHEGTGDWWWIVVVNWRLTIEVDGEL